MANSSRSRIALAIVILALVCVSEAVTTMSMKKRSRYSPSGGYKTALPKSPVEIPQSKSSFSQSIPIESESRDKKGLKRTSYAPSLKYWATNSKKSTSMPQSETPKTPSIAVVEKEQLRQNLIAEEAVQESKRQMVEDVEKNNVIPEKKQVLVDTLPIEATSSSASSSSSTSPSAPASTPSSSPTTTTKSNPSPPSFSLQTVKSAKFSELVEDLSVREPEVIATAVTSALKVSTIALVRLALSLLSAGTQFSLSPEIGEVGKSLSLAGLAASRTIEETKNVVESAKSTWKESVGDVPIETGTTDEYVGRIVNGVSAVTASPNVREAITKVSENAGKVGSELVTSVNITSKKIGQDLSASKTFKDSLVDLKGNIGVLAAAAFVAAKRVITGGRNSDR